jgi:hypothetical protein
MGGAACSDDSSGGGAGGAGGAGHAGTSSAAGASAGQQATGGSAGQQAAGGSPSGTSDYCKMYCQCHETNCASTAIPGGVSCFEFCATFSNDPMLSYCRLNMCTLVPAQPDNNHCVHSVGIGECL